VALDSGLRAVVLPGWLFTRFGSEFAESAQSATGFLLPMLLGGVGITIGGLRALPLFVSPNEINFQAPSRIQGATISSCGAFPDRSNGSPPRF
jgi:uncharacterized protein (TIGR03437 family)